MLAHTTTRNSSINTFDVFVQPYISCKLAYCSVKHNTLILTQTATPLQILHTNSFVARRTRPSASWHLPDVVVLWLVVGTRRCFTSSFLGLRFVVLTPVVVSAVDDWASKFSPQSPVGRHMSVGRSAKRHHLMLVLAATFIHSFFTAMDCHRVDHSFRWSPLLLTYHQSIARPRVGMALNGLFCADVPLRTFSLSLFPSI